MHDFFRNLTRFFRKNIETLTRFISETTSRQETGLPPLESHFPALHFGVLKKSVTRACDMAGGFAPYNPLLLFQNNTMHERVIHIPVIPTFG